MRVLRNHKAALHPDSHWRLTQLWNNQLWWKLKWAHFGNEIGWAIIWKRNILNILKFLVEKFNIFNISNEFYKFFSFQRPGNERIFILVTFSNMSLVCLFIRVTRMDSFKLSSWLFLSQGRKIAFWGIWGIWWISVFKLQMISSKNSCD